MWRTCKSSANSVNHLLQLQTVKSDFFFIKILPCAINNNVKEICKKEYVKTDFYELCAVNHQLFSRYII